MDSHGSANCLNHSFGVIAAGSENGLSGVVAKLAGSIRNRKQVAQGCAGQRASPRMARREWVHPSTCVPDQIVSPIPTVCVEDVHYAINWQLLGERKAARWGHR